jgi:hypothetical protein
MVPVERHPITGPIAALRDHWGSWQLLEDASAIPGRTWRRWARGESRPTGWYALIAAQCFRSAKIKNPFNEKNSSR